MRILFADDDDVTLFLYKRLAKKHNLADVHFAKDGAEALEWILVSETNYDLLMLDLNMPRLDGFQFLEEHAKLPVNKRVKHIYVMLGSQTDDSKKQQLINLNVSGFIEKPLNEEKFNALLDKALL